MISRVRGKEIGEYLGDPDTAGDITRVAPSFIVLAASSILTRHVLGKVWSRVGPGSLYTEYSLFLHGRAYCMEKNRFRGISIGPIHG